MVIILLGSNSISLPLFFWVLIPEKSEIFPSHCHLLWIKRFLVTKVAWIKGYPEYAWIFPLVAEHEKWGRRAWICMDFSFSCRMREVRRKSGRRDFWNRVLVFHTIFVCSGSLCHINNCNLMHLPSLKHLLVLK